MKATTAIDAPPVTYRWLKRLAWLVVSIFYREIKVVGGENLRADRPTVLVVNHANSLGDPAVLLGVLPGLPRYLAAGSWWRSAPARWLFGLAGVVPIHRRRDGAPPVENQSIFASCHAALAGGAHLAMFPEGELSEGPSLLPMKTGAARIALGAAFDVGVDGIAIVPVGLVYEDKGRFRSRTTVEVGPAIDVDRYADHYRTDPRDAVRRLTEDIGASLRTVTLNAESWDDLELVNRAVAAATVDRPDDSILAPSRNDLHRSLVNALGRDGAADLTRPALAAAVADHDADLAALGFGADCDPPVLEGPPPGAGRQVARELVALAPIALVGVAVNGPVALAIYAYGRRVRDPAWRATVKGLAGVVLCPVVWCTEAILLRRRGRNALLGFAVVAPASGLAAIAWRDRWVRWRAFTELEKTIERDATLVQDALSSRRALQEQIAAILAPDVEVAVGVEVEIDAT